MLHGVIRIAVVLGIWGAAVYAQQTSGSIGGVVVDSQGMAVPQAQVTLLDQQQGATRQMTTTADGSFVFTPVPPSEYTLKIEAAGFKALEKRGIRLYANDRLAIPDLVLEVGTTSETITVTASAAQLQTESAERSGVLTSRQVVDLALTTRNFMQLMQTIPGIKMVPISQGLFFRAQVNGMQEYQNAIRLDGVTNNDSGSGGCCQSYISMDAIAEFKVITNSHTADMGRSSGASVNVVTKSGTQAFHGSGYYFRRHDSLNANYWLNNINGAPRPIYRFNTYGFTVGGPIYIPKKFNTSKQKLFFFVAGEWQELMNLSNPIRVRVPTEPERDGDFSQSREADGSPLVIRDPANNRTPFPGNVIPAARINADGQRLLKFLPLPMFSGDPTFNFVSQINGEAPIRFETYRVDYNINDSWRLFVRVQRDVRRTNNPYGGGNTAVSETATRRNGLGAVLNLTSIFNPRLTNEFIFGPTKLRIRNTPEDDNYTRSRLGLSYESLYPSAINADLGPNVTFGGVPNAATLGLGGLPNGNTNSTFDFSDNLSQVLTSHLIKAGFYFSRDRKDQYTNNPVGNLAFGRDSQNPLDSNWAYSNALLGNFLSYSQADLQRLGLYRFTNAEWYVQDTWRVKRNLTLDLGIRFYIIQPIYDARLQIAAFNSSYYDPMQSVALYARDRVNGQIVARNPNTGEIRPAVLVGAIAPGKGNPDNGYMLGGFGGYPRGLQRNRGVHYSPRIGVAWTPRSDTVVRLGGGIMFDRTQGNPTINALNFPPTTRTPQLYYGNLTSIQSLEQAMFPQNLSGSWTPEGYVPTTYNYNLTIQHKLPKSIVVDAGYVGSISRHLVQVAAYNEPGFGCAWRPENQDPLATVPRFDGTTTLPINYYRPYIGSGQINMYTTGSTSSYNALQISANRRSSRGLQFGVAYTYGKAIGVGDTIFETLHPTNVRQADYGRLGYDLRHMLTVNYIYTVPAVARPGFLDYKIARLILNGWQLSGITTIQSGAPGNVGYSIQGISAAELNRRTTGQERFGPRPVILSNPNLSGNRTDLRYFDTGVFRPAEKGSIGIDSGTNILDGPGMNNWDISVFKNIPLGGDASRYMQLRLEMFNAWNHTQYMNVNRSAIFNAAGLLTNLPTALGGGGGRFGFGAVTAARDPRVIQLAIKAYF